MSAPTLVIEPLAEADVATIFEYIQRIHRDAAIRWYQAFQTAAEQPPNGRLKCPIRIP
ncbi:MAG: hypothetical protein KDA89_00085 [Planctomycetaceae bacterium]|nr:hypothetical protein [Planctomycetaceae bacterium]